MNTHPASVGKQNQIILDHLASAYTAALALAAEGYTVLDVKIGNRNPKIIIQPGRRCRNLQGALRMIDNTGPVRQNIYAARYRDAQVEWRETP